MGPAKRARPLFAEPISPGPVGRALWPGPLAGPFWPGPFGHTIPKIGTAGFRHRSPNENPTACLCRDFPGDAVYGLAWALKEFPKSIFCAPGPWWAHEPLIWVPGPYDMAYWWPIHRCKSLFRRAQAACRLQSPCPADCCATPATTMAKSGYRTTMAQ